MKEAQKWTRLDGDDGWQIVMPLSDSKPHATKKISKTEMELAWLDCPCKPKVALEDKIIIHNSFIDMEAIEKSLQNLPLTKS